MPKLDCPDNQLLRQYVLGECPDELFDKVEQHLSDCTVCEETLAQFDRTVDSLMRHLPLAASTTRKDAPAAWIDALRGQFPGAISTADQADVEPGALPSKEQPWADGFANYQVLDVLGRGGMGVVFLARHVQLNRRVALKVVRPDAISSDLARRRFQREIQVLGRLSHPGIVMATDAGMAGPGAYLVMEWIDGIDLGRLVRETGPLPVESACEACRQIADALAAAHDNGVIHRDVKPSNAMVDATGRVRLLDFGLAHMTRVIQSSVDTSIGRLLGTLDYMAPEQAAGEGAVDARSDLYSLGALLFFLLTGRPPHGRQADRTILEHLRRISLEDAPRVSSLRVDLPAELDELIAQLLQRDPSARPESATQLASRLSTWSVNNLAARVADALPQRSQSDDSVQVSAARQSLAELLNVASIPAGVSQSLPASQTINPARRRIGRWVLSAGLAALLLWAVTLLIQTPQGTLRIDAEVGDVTVEVLDAKDRPRELQIKPGTNETQLLAGEYRIRLAGQHDDLQLDRNTITLRSGTETIARITRVENPTSEREIASAPGSSQPVGERLFQGRAESDWKHQFELETDLTTKLDAGRALLLLSAGLPPREQIERILDLGEEFVRTGWGDRAIEYALSTSNYGPNWPQVLGTVTNADKLRNEAAELFSRELQGRVQNLRFPEISDYLLTQITEGNAPRAMFAASLLYRRWTGPQSASVRARQGGQNRQGNGILADSANLETTAEMKRFLLRLNVPITGLDRSAICQFLRLYFMADWAAVQEWKLENDFFSFATLLEQSPITSTRQILAARFLAIAHQVYDRSWKPEQTKLMAQLVLHGMVDDSAEIPRRDWTQMVYGGGFSLQPNTPSGFYGTPGTSPIGGLRIDYDPGSIEKLREQNRHFLDGWLIVVNEYLQTEAAVMQNRALFTLLQSLEVTSRIYSEGDDWPAKATAALLLPIRAALISEPRRIHDIAMVDAIIVRLKGELPDELRQAPRLRDFQIKTITDLWEGRDGSVFQEIKALLFSAPYATVETLCDVSRAPTNEERQQRFETLQSLLMDNGQMAGDMSTAFDPVLLLGIFHDLVGQSETRDEVISLFLSETGVKKLFKLPLHNILQSRLHFRPICRQWLEEMRMKTKSTALAAQLNELLAEKGNELKPQE